MRNRYKTGFTLIEMAIVLVIIGVLVGGILLGRSLLVSSQLKTVMTDADSYITATANFKQQYQALPGDMANATSLWGTDNLGCPSGGGTSGTCNGNGDGMIGYYAVQDYEIFRFWQHLYYAGMFNQRLNGVASSGGVYDATVGANIPAGSVSGSGFFMTWFGTISGGLNYYPAFYGHVLMFGKTFTNGGASGAVLTPEQAASIDSKIDDGLPATGKVRALLSTSPVTPNCTTTAVAATAAYNLTNANPLCSLLFVTGY